MQSYLRHLGRVTTTMEQIDIMKRQNKLLTQITAHQWKAKQFISEAVSEQDDYSYERSEVFLPVDDGDIDLVKCNDASYPFNNMGDGPRPKIFNITMPSSGSRERFQSHAVRDIQSLKVQLRLGQCNDSLKGVRLSLGKKAFLFWTEI